jgi:hypothetical protein
LSVSAAGSKLAKLPGEHVWSKEQNAFVCSCHGSIFDARNAAEVIGGRIHVVTVPSTFSGYAGVTQSCRDRNHNSCLRRMRRMISAAFFVFASFSYLPSRSTFPFASSFIFLTVGSELIWPVVSVRVAGGPLFGTDV